MATSSSNSWGESRNLRTGAEVPSGQRADSPTETVRDHLISKYANIVTAEDERPELKNDKPGPMVGGETDFARFAMWLPIAPTRQISDYRHYCFIDMIRFLQDENTEIRREASQRIVEVEASLTANHQAQIVALEDQHRKQALLSEGKVQELMSSLQVAQAEVKNTTIKLAAATSDLQGRNKGIQNLKVQLSKEKKRCSDLTKSQTSTMKQMNDMKLSLESKLLHEEDSVQVLLREVQHLGSIVKEKDEALGDLQSARDQLISENEKLRSQIALIEKKSAQESWTRGLHTEGRANPCMLMTAALTVDKATDELAKFLYDSSCKFGIFKTLIGISRARPRDFARPAHMKHVWGHWICEVMFQGFEHVYFDVPEHRTSPLDLEKFASDCFQTYQQKKDVPSLDYFKERGFFRKYCCIMFPEVFPAYLVTAVKLLDSEKCCETGGGLGGCWNEPGELRRLFLEVAKAIWLLHELAFSFQHPASILRVRWGDRFDNEYQESVIKDDDNMKQPMKVVLMLRPGFRVNKSVIKSRVLLSNRV